MITNYPLRYSIEQWNVFIHYRVLRIWEKSKQNKKDDLERFGVLIGRRFGKEVFIECVTQPYEKDQATRGSFILQDPKHQKIVSRAFKCSSGKLGYLGTWHTHPERIPIASAVDKRDWESCLNRNKDRELFFFIIGKESICLYFKKENRFVRVNEDE